MQGAGGNFKAAGVGCGWGPAWEGLSEDSCVVPDVCGDQMGKSRSGSHPPTTLCASVDSSDVVYGCSMIVPQLYKEILPIFWHHIVRALAR